MLKIVNLTKKYRKMFIDYNLTGDFNFALQKFISVLVYLNIKGKDFKMIDVHNIIKSKGKG